MKSKLFLIVLIIFIGMSGAVAQQNTTQRKWSGVWYRNYPMEIVLNIAGSRGIVSGNLNFYGSSWCEDETKFTSNSDNFKTGSISPNSLILTVGVDGCDDVTINIKKSGNGEWRGRLSSIVDNRSYRINLVEN